MPELIPVFDGHNDALLRLVQSKVTNPAAAFLNGREGGHLDLPRMRSGGFAGGMFAIFVPSNSGGGPDAKAAYQRDVALHDWPMPPMLEAEQAQRTALQLASLLLRIESASSGRVKICRTAAEVSQCISSGVIAAVMHMEGAEAIDPEFHMLDVLYAAGLRSLGPVWSRPTIFGHGVPFRFPSSPDIGPGLTELGRELVKLCGERGILLDVSHLNEKGFWDVVRLSDRPIVATHSNAHAICPHSRNLTDVQLSAIRETGGIVGANFEGAFIRSDGRRDPKTTLDDLIRHIDHLVDKAGADCVGLGSDFDGAILPEAIADVAGLPRLTTALRAHGYDDETLRKIYFENWLRVLKRTFGG